MDRNEIIISDVGDNSVGILPSIIIEVKVSDSFLKVLREEKTLEDFRKKLVELCTEFYEPEVCYDSYMIEDDDWEDKYE